MDKPIDLGKLQDEQRKADAKRRSLYVALQAAYKNADKANAALDAMREKHKLATDELDKARRAVVEGARAVANGG